MGYDGRLWQLLRNYIQKMQVTWSKRKKEGIKRQERRIEKRATQTI